MSNHVDRVRAAAEQVRRAEEWCDSHGDGPQPFTFGTLTAAALVLLNELEDR